MADYFDANGDVITIPDKAFDADGNEVQVVASTDKLVHLSRDQIRSLEEKANNTDASEASRAAAERELAFYKAGLPMTDPKTGEPDPKMAYFTKGYDGDLEPDKIREAAASAGFIAASSNEPTPDDVDAQARIDEVGNAAFSNPDGTPLEDAINAAQTQEEVMDVMRQSGLPVVKEQ